MRRNALITSFSLMIAMSLARSLPAQNAGTSAEVVHQHWVEIASEGVDPQAAEVLHRIRGASRQLLALRAYLRAGPSLSARWSWSQEKLTRYPMTAEGKAAAADIDSVIARFVHANPGYELQVNRQPRSLEVQLGHWNENASVATVAAALVKSLDRQFAYARTPTTAQLRDTLMQWAPATAATLAAPGLSAHGQGRAFDFSIARDGRIVAGLDAVSARSRWDDAGWTKRLHEAVVASGKAFTGPLASPYEPWHYAYMPDSAQPQ